MPSQLVALAKQQQVLEVRQPVRLTAMPYVRSHNAARSCLSKCHMLRRKRAAVNGSLACAMHAKNLACQCLAEQVVHSSVQGMHHCSANDLCLCRQNWMHKAVMQSRKCLSGSQPTMSRHQQNSCEHLCMRSHEPHNQRQLRVQHCILKADDAQTPQQLPCIILQQLECAPADLRFSVSHSCSASGRELRYESSAGLHEAPGLSAGILHQGVLAQQACTAGQCSGVV